MAYIQVLKGNFEDLWRKKGQIRENEQEIERNTSDVYFTITYVFSPKQKMIRREN